MSLVQPTRAPTANGNNVGVKRPYQLMINSAAHNTNDAYPGRFKNIKFDKDHVCEDINEDNLVCLFCKLNAIMWVDVTLKFYAGVFKCTQFNYIY